MDWFPWGDEALAEARRRDVPIFLSVGYSACHWCHVMVPGHLQNRWDLAVHGVLVEPESTLV